MKVSVIIPTYNHEKYISQAIESVLSQKTDFDYEILIGEDGSSDRTLEIVKDYESKHKRIKVIKNGRKPKLFIHGQQTGRINLLNLINRSRGEYIALLEGDDYWTTSNKLIKQVKLLDKKTTCTLCSHKVKVYDEVKNTYKNWPETNIIKTHTTSGIIRNGSIGATCSLVFRKNCFDSNMEILKKTAGLDWVLQVLLSTKGEVIYLPNNMGTYRRHPGGRSSITTTYKDKKYIYDEGGLKICKELSKVVSPKFKKDLDYIKFNYYYPQLIKNAATYHKLTDFFKYVFKKQLVIPSDHSRIKILYNDLFILVNKMLIIK